VEQFMTGAEYGPRKDEHMRGMIKTVGGDLLFELQYCKPDNHIKGTSEHTKRMVLMICLGKKPNPTQEVPDETIIRGFRSAWQQQFDGNY